MQHAQSALIACLLRIMRMGKKVIGKAQFIGKAGQDFHADLPTCLFKIEHGVLELW